MTFFNKGAPAMNEALPAFSPTGSREPSVPHSLPFVSVIIPVFDDFNALNLCLDCLSRQSYPSKRTEIIVVDNGSSCDLTPVTAERRGVSLLHQPKPGSYAARNLGVKAARGDIIAFTDADCRPRHDWLEAGVAALQGDPDIVLLGGLIENVRERTGTLSLAEVHQNLRAFPQKRYVEELNFAATANVLTYKRVFDRIGFFNEKLFSNGDKEWGQRVHAQGCRLGFCPDAVVDHPVRDTLRKLLQKKLRQSGGQFQLRRLSGQSHLAAVGETALKPLRLTLGDGPHRSLPWKDQARFLAVEWVIAAARLLEMLRLISGGAPRRR